MSTDSRGSHPMQLEELAASLAGIGIFGAGVQANTDTHTTPATPSHD